ncbi:hypothetical protein [Microbulbifer sp. S227A]|uniref:hypothetical protein n=1 Tax=Microbulbifer sp. S227A TaxID=3415131 RepID=UPI003C7C927C
MTILAFIQGKASRWSSILGGLSAIVLAFNTTGPANTQNLWEGEITQEAAGFPFITKLMIVDPDLQTGKHRSSLMGILNRNRRNTL